MITGPVLKTLFADYGTNKPLCSGRTDEANYHCRGNFFYQVPEMEPADTGRRRHGDTHGRPFEEKGDG